MLSLEQIREKLKDRKLAVVSQATKVSRVTLYRVLDESTKSVNSATLDKLSKYFEGQV